MSVSTVAPSKGRPVLAYVVNSLNPGGTEKLVVEMSLAFCRDFNVHVFCLDEPGLWAKTLREHGVPVACLWRQPGLDLRISVLLAGKLRKCGAKIVHAHQCTPWFYAALSRLFYPRPRLVLQEHGRFFPEFDRWMRRIINATIIRRLTHHFVAVSEDVKKRLVRYEGLDSTEIAVIYNGVLPQPRLSAPARYELRRALGFGESDFVVGTVGRFDPIKNLPMLVNSLAAVRTSRSDVRGLLVGDGPEIAPIRRLVDDLGLANDIQLTGFRDDARMLVQCMDLFVLSSVSEGTSVALLEAVAGRVPVAVTEVGGNPEIVRMGQTGWVVPSGAVESLTAVILEAASNPDRCEKYVTSGLVRFEERFTFGRMIASYRDLYSSLGAAVVQT